MDNIAERRRFVAAMEGELPEDLSVRLKTSGISGISCDSKEVI